MAAHPLVPPGQTGTAATPTLHLLGGPFVTAHGARREVPEGGKRLLVFLALHPGAVKRQRVAGALWPDGDEARALGNLRSALWRLRLAGIDVVASDKWSLVLRAGVVVDLRLVSEWAGRLVRGTHLSADLAVPTWSDEALDLLPGWYDDWVLMERERVRQLVLHALEALSRRLVVAARCAEAVEAAMLAVGAEPLRESAQRALIEAHLAEGNWVEGRRAYLAYRALLGRELGVVPSADLAGRLGLDRPHPAGAVGNPTGERRQDA